MTTLGARAEYNHATRKYYIYRPATDDRPAVDYEISDQEVMKKLGSSILGLTFDQILELLTGREEVDAVLKPIRRREAIEHTRNQHGK